MESSEKSMTEKESMELIVSMINKAKSSVVETGWLYLLWGWLIFICCIVQFIGTHFFHVEQIGLIWLLTWVLLIYQIFFIAKERKKKKVKTYTKEINNFVWIVFFISMMLVIVIAIHYRHPEMISPLLLVSYGMPTFLSGIILKFKPLIIGGIICWVLSLVSLITSLEYQLLLIALAIICGWIIPGYLLRKKYYHEIANRRDGV